MLLDARRAHLDDAPAVGALVNAAFQVEAFFKRGPRTSPAGIRALMAQGEFLVVDRLREDDEDIRRPGDALAACVYVKHNGERGYFGMLSVNPDCQGRGLGTALVAAVESYVRAAGCRELDIHVVNLREELLPFYHRLGYVPTGTLPFPDDEPSMQPCHFIVMTKRL